MKEYSRPGEREVILERKQVVLLFGGGVIALILVFVLGVLFGKNLAERRASKQPAQIAKQAVFPEKTVPGPKTPGETQVAQGATAPGIKLATGETAKILEKINEQQPPPELTGTAKEATTKPTTPPTTSKPTTTTTAPPSKPVTAPATTTKPTTTETKPQPLPNFAIQVAAFEVASFPDKAQAQAKADELVKKLKTNKWDAYWVLTDIPGKGLWYRVYVGRYETRELADKALTVFKSKEPEHKDAFIRKLE